MQSGRHHIRPLATKPKTPPKLSFADTAPPEVLGQVFFHCIPSSEEELRGTSFIDAPLLLLQVCRSWRQIALQTPNLWTNLDFTYPFKLDGRSTFQLWLSKAGALPIKLTFDTHDYAPKSTEAGLMELFLRYFHRISSFSGVLGTCFGDALMRANLPIRGSKLERFDIRDGTGLDEDMAALEASIQTPQLKHFKMDGPWFLMPVLSFSPSILQSFSLTRVEWEIPALHSLELIHLLGRCSNLKALEFTVCEETISDSLRESDRLVFVKLRRLVLHVVFESVGTIMFFRTLQIPNVEHIEFRPEHDATAYRGARWMDVLLRRPLPHLRSLVLEHIDFNIRDARETPQTDSFLALTSLETLQFDHCVLNRDTIDVLVPSQYSHSQWRLPSLSRLVVNGGEMDWGAMMRLVKSRAPNRTSPRSGVLRNFEVENSRPPTSSDRRILEQHRSASNGLFNFRVPSPYMRN